MNWLARLSSLQIILAAVLTVVALSMSVLLSQRRKKLYRAILVSWAFIFILAFFGPGILTLGWHLRHGMSFPYQGKNVPVPMAWTAGVGELQRVELTRFPILLVSRDIEFEWISLGPSPYPAGRTREQITQSFNSIFWTLTYSKDAVVSGPFNIGQGVKQVVCMQAVPRYDSERSRATCIIFDEGSIADFLGKKEDLKTFFRIIRGIH